MRLGVSTIVLVLAFTGCKHEPDPYVPPDPPPPMLVDAGPPPPRPSFPDAGPPPPSTALPSAPAVEPRPAVAGGTLLVTSAGLVVAADPDRASLWIVDPAERALRGRLALAPGDEPGRLAEDGAGRVHVVLRGAGEIARIDPTTIELVDRRPVCAAPRGLAWDADGDLLHVACAGGELVTLPAGGGAPLRSSFVDTDLRDVVIADGALYVSRFHTAELLTVDRVTGDVLARRAPAPRDMARAGSTRANTAWRTRALPGGGVVMVHQQAISSTIDPEAGGYSGSHCRGSGVVVAAVSTFAPGATVAGGGAALSMTPLAVDLAPSLDGANVALALAAHELEAVGVTPVVELSTGVLGDDCALPNSRARWGEAVTAIDRMPDGRLVTFSPDPLRIEIEGTALFAGDSLPVDVGHSIFHRVTPSFVACASCHPEGGEDGHTWDFAATGQRRTQSLLGGLLATTPFHWSGDQPDMSAIMDATFVQRMGAGFVSPDQVTAVATWLDSLPTPPGSITDADAVARGRALFEDTTVACASCHAGATLTNNENANVGRGGAFQVPSLHGVLHRAPYFHDACAPTLEAVVNGACGTLDLHGHTSHLDAAARADLVSYLRSL